MWDGIVWSRTSGKELLGCALQGAGLCVAVLGFPREGAVAVSLPSLFPWRLRGVVGVTF